MWNAIKCVVSTNLTKHELKSVLTKKKKKM